jgi:X-X-X-Leu-X-X-Gly heptad repeat protein
VPPGPAIQNNYSLPPTAFASQQDLSNGLTQLSNGQAQLNSGQAQLNNGLLQLTNTQNQLANMINQERTRESQGAALAGAMTINPPNNGDRFSLTVSGAGFDSQGAGQLQPPTGQHRGHFSLQDTREAATSIWPRAASRSLFHRIPAIGRRRAHNTRDPPIGEWWLCGNAKPWQPDTVTVVGDRVTFRPP